MNRKYKQIYVLLFLIISINLLIASFSYCELTRGKALRIQLENKEPMVLYEASYALVIGNNDYQYEEWGKLDNAVNDAKEVAEELKNHGFEVTLETNTTKDHFEKVFNDFFFDKEKIKEKTRLLFYYAGHGFAFDHPFKKGNKIGYLIMIDTPHKDEDYSGFQTKAIELDDIEKKSNRIKAHHALFMFDSCFSGSLFSLSRGGGGKMPHYITENIRKPIRLYICAGENDETVPDNSIFKKYFLRLIRGQVSEPIEDGYLTGMELGGYLKRMVVQSSKKQQHPQYARSRFPELQEGDFVFEIQSKKSNVVSKPQKMRGSNKKCVKTSLKYTPEIPFALYPSIDFSKYIDWLYVYLENQCSQDVKVSFVFDMVSGPGQIDGSKIYKTVKKGKKYDGSVTLPIKIMNHDSDDKLSVSWEIFGIDDTRVDRGTFEIGLISKKKYCWNLKNNNGKKISDDFMMASLSAWAFSGNKSLKTKAKKMKKTMITRKKDKSQRIQQWFQKCYELVNDSQEVEIVEMNESFPPISCRTLFSSSEVIEEEFGDPIEVALLFGALTNMNRYYKKYGLNLALLIFTENDNSKESQFVVLTWSLKKKQWHSIDMTKTDLDFDENLKETSQIVNEKLLSNPNFMKALIQNGVYIDKEDHIYAVMFNVAAKKFGIKSLP